MKGFKDYIENLNNEDLTDLARSYTNIINTHLKIGTKLPKDAEYYADAVKRELNKRIKE